MFILPRVQQNHFFFPEEFLYFRRLAGPLQTICSVRESASEIHIFTRSLAHTAACPCCDQISASLHATYHRRIQTLPLRRKYTCLRMTAYKFDCVNPRCPQKVFMESLFPADRWQVRSRQLTALILALSAFLKDEGASRVLAACGARVSNDTIRRVIRQAAPSLCPPVFPGRTLRLTSPARLERYSRRVIHAIWSYLRRDSVSQPLVSFFYQKLAPGFRR